MDHYRELLTATRALTLGVMFFLKPKLGEPHTFFYRVNQMFFGGIVCFLVGTPAYKASLFLATLSSETSLYSFWFYNAFISLLVATTGVMLTSFATIPLVILVVMMRCVKK